MLNTVILARFLCISDLIPLAESWTGVAYFLPSQYLSDTHQNGLVSSLLPCWCPLFTCPGFHLRVVSPCRDFQLEFNCMRALCSGRCRCGAWNPSWSFSGFLFFYEPGRCLNFGGERRSGLLVDSSSAVDCKLTAENMFESSWIGTGDKRESRTEGW